MADPMNPFAEDLEENLTPTSLIQDEVHNATKESSPDSLPDAQGVSLDQVAAKLLKERLLLTSLELHTELLESGRELPRLRDFFSNPANFERTRGTDTLTSPTGLPRTSSVQTFDSLDFARYSDDGVQQENDKMAVLEFELRKAQETIKSLRETLTKTAEPELSTPEQQADKLAEFGGQGHDDAAIKPYERRALNFLVNEYLLLNDYKVSSVTLAEENEDQDFEDWDDVGLNLPKPAGLLAMWRDYGQQVAVADTFDAEVQTGEDEVLRCLEEKLQELKEEISRLSEENGDLMQQIASYERGELSVPVHTSTPARRSHPPMQEDEEATDNLEDTIEAEEMGMVSLGGGGEGGGGGENLGGGGDINPGPPPTGLEYRSIADPPARPETEGMDSSELCRRRTPTDSAPDPTPTPSSSATSSSTATTSSSGGTVSTVVTAAAATETPGAPKSDLDSLLAWQPSHRKMSAAFQKALLGTAFHVSHDNRIIAELSNITDSSGDTVVLMLGRCLPHIVPNVLIAKREELIPLLLCTATLHPDPKQRDQLLNILFNLIKKPDLEQRQLILTGCVAFAQHVGAQRVEAELLPQCWEQLAHKYPERRLLVAESCGTLAPYIPGEMRGSLVLSMLQQMVTDDKAEEVREAAVRSLGLLMGFVDDHNKFNQGVELLVLALGGPERVVAAAQAVLLPALAVWAVELDKLHAHLIPTFLTKLSHMLDANTQSSAAGAASFEKARFCLYVHTLHELIPHLFAMVLCSGPYAEEAIQGTPPPISLTRFPAAGSELSELAVIVGDGGRLARLEQLYEEHIAQDWHEPWEAYAWVAEDFIPQLISLLNQVEHFIPEVIHSLTQLLAHICLMFGHTFTIKKVKPQFQVELSMPEEHIDSSIVNGESAVTKATVPVYTAGVLAVHNDPEDLEELSAFLKDLLCTLSLCQVSLDCLKATFVQLSLSAAFHDLLLSVLWDGVVHTSAHVRSTAAVMFQLLVEGVTESMIASRIIPALVTLASDPEMTVRIATVPAFGTIMETVSDRSMLDKVQLQFQNFLDDPGYADQQQMQLALIKTLAKVGPNAEPRFRDDFVLPRLAIIAAGNNHVSVASRRQEVALQLFEAYSALSCCFMSVSVVEASMLPGLRCLLRDCQDVQPDLAAVVTSIIHDLDHKMANRGASDHHVAPGGPGPLNPHDSKSNVFRRFSDIKDRASASKSKVSSLFSKK